MARFKAFVMFAEMRTGSNYLEDTLATLPDVTCYGEVWNPTFLGRHNQFELFGYDMDRREAEPLGLLDALIAQTQGLLGFRLFHDHDARVVERVLPDPEIAKIILTRNPLDSYVSRKIATATGQWRLTDMKSARSARIRFDAEEFRDLLGALMPFQDHLRKGLQRTGQTPFLIRYEDLGDADALNGLAAFLGSRGRIEAPSGKLKKQNPQSLREKVENFDEMVAALADLDRFGIEEAPQFEPERHPAVRSFIAHPTHGLVFLPIRGSAGAAITDWMGRIDDVGPDALLRGLSQKEMRQWMKAHPGFRSFSIVRHPLRRAAEVFDRYILSTDRPNYADPRRILRQRYKVPIPAKAPGADWDAAAHKAGLMAFLGVVAGNLVGQTSLRVDPAWASQTVVLQGMSGFCPPHHILRDEDDPAILAEIARAAGVEHPPAYEAAPLAGRVALDLLHDGKLERAAIEAYRKDYMSFGYDRLDKGG